MTEIAKDFEGTQNGCTCFGYIAMSLAELTREVTVINELK
jgi:hypothetical protein